MKQYFLLKSDSIYGSTYYFSEGKTFNKRRNQEEWGPLDESKLVSKIKVAMNQGIIDPKRKTVLNLVDFSDELRERIASIFGGTRIELNYMSKFT